MEIFLKGYHKSFSKLLIDKSKKNTTTVLINLHGLYGLSGDPRSKSKKLAETLTQKGIAHVVNFNSSRDWNIYKDGDWGKMKKAFEEKTFEQELQDAKDAVELVIENSEYLFGIKKSKLKLIFVGNSLGGVVATCLDDYFEYVAKIIAAGSGTRTVFPTKLSEKQILNKAAKFRRNFLLIQGSKDDVVPLKAGDALLAGYKNAKIKKIVIYGANHQFLKINGKNKKKAHQSYIDAILSFIS